jgi:hypothetical protein
MNLKRTTMIGIGAALVAWFAGAATSNRPAAPPAIVRQTPIEKRGAELAIEIERLHERLAPAIAPSAPGRNLFAFRAMAARAVAPAPAAPAAAAITESVAPPIALPPLKLSGIAEDAGDDGPVRQAFINGGGQLFIVKEGDTVTPRYRVAKISADVVELTDVIDNSIRRLALR